MSNMSKNEIISEIYQQQLVSKLLQRYKFSEKTENLQDLEQDLYILLMRLPEDLLQELFQNGKLRNWISATLCNQVRSKTSFYFKTYKQLKNKSCSLNEAIVKEENI